MAGKVARIGVRPWESAPTAALVGPLDNLTGTRYRFCYTDLMGVFNRERRRLEQKSAPTALHSL
jgi:hypothetical protein